MKVAVTGGSGFIGQRLVQRLVQEGHDVVSVDIRQPNTTTGFKFVKADLTNIGEAQLALRECETVYHLAGVVLEYVREDPFVGSAVNINLTRNLVEASKALHLKKVLFASSFYVYDGISPELIVNEESPLNTLRMELFGVTKVFGETLLKEYNRKYGLNYVILRFGSAYGIGNSTNVIKTFLEAALQGRPLEIWGEGKRRNQYTYVDDIVEGCMHALDSANETFNVISPEDTSVSEVANQIASEYTCEVIYRRDRSEGSSMPYMSSRKIAKELHWKPISLREGINKMIKQMSQAQLLTY